MELNRNHYRATVAAIVALIAVFFIGASLLFLSHERQALYDELERDTQTQAGLVTAFVREALARHDYLEVERFFARWGAENKMLVGATAVMDNGFELAQYQHPTFEGRSMTVRRRVDYAPGKFLDFTMTVSLVNIEKRLATLRNELSVMALVFAVIFATVLWQTMRRLALAPLEKEIDEHRQTVHMLDESRRRLAFHIENTPLGVIAWNQDFTCNQWNSAAEAIFGFSKEEAIGANALKILVPEHIHEQIDAIFTELMNQGEVSHSINENLTKDGRTILCEWFNTPLKDERGKNIGVASVVRDITEQRALEAALQENEERFRSMVENAGDAIYIHDRFGKIYDVNHVACTQTGYPREELVAMSVAQLDAAIELESLQDTWELGEANPDEYPITLETAHRRKDGSIFPIEVRISLLPSEEHGFLFVAMVRDITDRKRIEQELAFQKSALDQHAIVSIADVRGDIIYVNDKFCTISGYSRQELIGRNHRILKCDEYSQDFYEKLWQAIFSGKTWNGIIKNRAKNGEPYWVDATIVPFPDENGKPFQFVAISTDITERIHAKEEAETANMAKSEFLSSMSHELRTPLNAIVGFSQLLESDPDQPLTEDQAESVHQIKSGGDHLLNLINEILDLAKIESGNMTISVEPVMPHDVVETCITMARELGRKSGVSVGGNCAELGPMGTVSIMVDQNRFRQVLLNLLSNAVKYNHPGGEVSLACKRSGPDYLHFSVSDTGTGIPEHLQDELFQPFHRLNAENTEIEGTGIGLAITRRLVEAMNGRIGFVSEEGRGSTFWVEFPVVEEPGNETDADLPAATETAGTAEKYGTVLYVEDNPANLKLMAKVFMRMPGLRMISAHNAEIGLLMAEQEQPDLILMDINLPGMDGIEALGQIEGNPKTAHIPVVAVSANAMAHDIDKAMKAGFKAYITKPFNIDDVLETIRMNLG